jgi:hypothetical protein
MLNNNRIDWVLEQTNISRVMAFRFYFLIIPGAYSTSFSMPLVGCEPYEMDDRFLEYSHDYVHYFVNGDMEDRVTSSNDPGKFLLD